MSVNKEKTMENNINICIKHIYSHANGAKITFETYNNWRV